MKLWLKPFSFMLLPLHRQKIDLSPFSIRLVWCHLRQVIFEQEPTHIERK